MDEIKEIRIKEVRDLSEKGKKEVMDKLKKLPATFDFIGYAKVFYVAASPLKAVEVEPIEGNIIDELHRLNNDLMKK